MKKYLNFFEALTNKPITSPTNNHKPSTESFPETITNPETIEDSKASKNISAMTPATTTDTPTLEVSHPEDLTIDSEIKSVDSPFNVSSVLHALPFTNDHTLPLSAAEQSLVSPEERDLIHSDEVIDLNDFDTFLAEEIFNDLLAPSKKVLASIEDYLRENPTTDNLTDQYYLLGGDKIFLSMTQICAISEIISDMRNMSDTAYLVANQHKSNLYNPLTSKIIAALDNATFTEPYSEILKPIPAPVLSQIVVSVLNKNILHEIKDKNISSHLKLNNVLESLGRSVLHHYLQTNVFYLTTLEESSTKESVHYKKRNVNDLQVVASFLISETLTQSQLVEFFNFTVENKKLFDIVAIALKLEYHMRDFFNPPLVDAASFIAKHDKTLLLFYYELGGAIFNFLKGADVLEVKTDAKKVPHIILTSTLYSNVFMSNTFAKPFLHAKQPKPDDVVVQVSENLFTKFKLNYQPYKNSTNTKLKPKADFYKMLKAADDMPCRVLSDNLEDFCQYYSEILKDNNAKTPNNNTLLFLKTLYNLDFTKILDNTLNKPLALRVINFGLNLSTFRNADLQEEVRIDFGLNHAYNIVSSYKFYIKGVLNDLFVFEKFKYFLITHYVTSTGRLFSHPQFLQFQGHKFVRNFMAPCAPQEDFSLTEDHFSQLKNIFVKHIPSLNGPSFTDITLENFTTQRKYLFKLYIESFFPPDIDLQNYPIVDSIKQIQWLSHHCKKSIYVFLVKHLLDSYLKGDIAFCFFACDATCSGIQLQSLEIRDAILARLTNVVGNSYNDIYAIFATSFNEKLALYEKNFAVLVDIFFHTDAVSFMTNYTKNKKEISLLNFSSDDFFEVAKRYTYDLSYYKLKRPLTLREVEKLVLDKLTKISKKKLLGGQKTEQEEALESIDCFYNQLMDACKEGLIVPLLSKTDTSLLNLEKPTELQKKVRTIMLALRYLKMTFELLQVTQRYPAISRNTFKNPVMTSSYNAGEASRIDGLKNHFTELLAEQGHSVIDTQEITFLANTLNSFFNVLSIKLLHSTKKFQEICSQFIAYHLKTKKPVVINQPYMQWVFEEYKVIKKRERVTYGTSSHNFETYQKTNEINEERMLTAFSSLFTHSLDAVIVHKAYFLCNEINIDCKTTFGENFPLLNLNTNHDCFSVNGFYAYMLKIIFSEIYSQVSNENYLQLLTVTENTKTIHEIYAKNKIKCSNANFIRH